MLLYNVPHDFEGYYFEFVNQFEENSDLYNSLSIYEPHS